MPHGNIGNKNGPHGRLLTGRSACLKTLDTMLSMAKNQKRLKEAFQIVFDKNPVAFYKHFVVPLIARESAKIFLTDDRHQITSASELVSTMDQITAPPPLTSPLPLEIINDAQLENIRTTSTSNTSVA